MFDRILMVDWSGGNDKGAKPQKDAIWSCLSGEEPIYHRNRQVAESYLVELLSNERDAGRRILMGMDLCYAFPTGFAERLVGKADPLAVWDWFEERVEDSPTANNRYELAGEINALFPGTGPFWFHPPGREIPNLPAKGRDRAGHGLPEKRAADAAAKGAFSPWQLGGAGAVGGQVFMGLPVLARLRRHFGGDLAIWPFEKREAPLVLAEVYFSLLPKELLTSLTKPAEIKDAAQTRVYAEAFSRLSADQWEHVLEVEATEEGWVLGLGHEDILASALNTAPTPPPLRNDCFAMPRGAYWTPVADALSHLRTSLRSVVREESCSIQNAGKRILARDVIAERSHPPHPNSAVDGYGFKGPAPEGINRLPLVADRAAAGDPFAGRVPSGSAVRILTGAILPEGVDTVVLQEDVSATESEIAFHGPLKAGSNARRAGEDMVAGQVILKKGRPITSGDIGMLAAAGIAEISVFERLRVGVLSTGDELRNPGESATNAQIYDANRPMLLDLIERWGFTAYDLGWSPDDQQILKSKLDSAASKCDVIITSGGASGGDEDHMSRLLKDTGSFALWRIAVKPGRPLAFGMWNQKPVIALPGNPVAAMVCTLIFARPALYKMAGADLPEPAGFQVASTFKKSKKAGRREYLRARLTQDGVERFESEGSGRVSGLSWATGLVELPDAACDVKPGDQVRFIPFSSFGI